MLHRTIGQVYISAQIFSCQSTWSLYWQLALCFDQFKQIKEVLVIYDTWRLPKFSSATKKDCGMIRLEVNKMKMGWWWWLKGMGGDLGSGFQGSYLTTQKPRKSQSWMRNRSSGFLPTRTSPTPSPTSTTTRTSTSLTAMRPNWRYPGRTTPECKNIVDVIQDEQCN